MFLHFCIIKSVNVFGVIFRYGRQVSTDDLNEIYGESRANGLGHEVKYFQLLVEDRHQLVYSSLVFSKSMHEVTEYVVMYLSKLTTD